MMAKVLLRNVLHSNYILLVFITFFFSACNNYNITDAVRMDEKIGKPGDETIYRQMLSEYVKHLESVEEYNRNMADYYAYISLIRDSLMRNDYTFDRGEIFADYLKKYFNKFNIQDKYFFLYLVPESQNTRLFDVLINQYNIESGNLRPYLYIAISKIPVDGSKDFLLAHIEDLHNLKSGDKIGWTKVFIDKGLVEYDLSKEDLRIINKFVDCASPEQQALFEVFLNNQMTVDVDEKVE